MPIRVHNATELTTAETAALGDLRVAVYPPEFMASWPGRSIEWDKPQWRAIVWDEDGHAQCHVGIFLRQGAVDGKPVKIGGIGGVMTHPDVRRKGFAAAAISQSIEFLREQQADFALLVCDPKLVAFYERLGWRKHGDTLMVTQHSKRVEFTFNLPMVRGVCTAGPTAGTIDLCGPPW
jgi:predicted GNAT family N-acyltransferase